MVIALSSSLEREMPPKDDNGWDEMKRLVLHRLEENACKLDCVDKKLSELRVDVAALKVKAGIWGLIGGSIPVIGFVLMQLIVKGG